MLVKAESYLELSRAFMMGIFPVIVRSSHQRRFVRKGVLRNFAEFTGKHLRQSLFFSKVAGLIVNGFQLLSQKASS